MKYRILVHTLDKFGKAKLLTFNKVESYTIEDGYLIFKDSHTNRIKRFAVAMTAIEEDQDAFN